MNRFSRIKALPPVLALVAVTLVVYVQVSSHKFINIDDNVYITGNPHVLRGLTAEGILWSLTSGYGLNWHPLTWVSHMLDVELFGLAPAGHHLTSLAIHVVNAVLLFLVFRRMTGAPGKSAFVAAVFALHPLHVESVAWAAERKDVLSTFFWLLAMASYARYAARPGRGRLALTGLCLALGLMAKPMLVTLPLVLLLLDYWPLGRLRPAGAAESAEGSLHGARRGTAAAVIPLVREKVPLFLLAVTSSVVTLAVQSTGAAVSTLEGLPLGIRVANALVSYAAYVKASLWPAGLAVFYPHRQGALPLSQVSGAAALLAILTALFLWRGRRRPHLAVGWLWFVGTLIPVIGLVQVGQQAHADRYLYVPLVGLSVVVAWGADDLLAGLRSRRVLVSVLAAVAAVLFAGMTRLQASRWRDSASLLAHAIRVTEDNYLAHNNLGAVLHVQRRYEEAAASYAEAVRIKPDLEIARQNLAAVLLLAGKPERAAAAHVSFGLMLERQGRWDEAVVQLSRAVRLDPGNHGASSALEECARRRRAGR